MKKSNIDKLYKYADEKLKDVNFNEGVYDVDFIAKAASDYLVKMVYQLDSGKYYYGQNNPEPTVIIQGIVLSQEKDINIIGKNQDTIRFEYNNITYIIFKAGDVIKKLSTMEDKINLTCYGTCSLNYWNGTTTPQILVKDVDVKNYSDLFINF